MDNSPVWHQALANINLMPWQIPKYNRYALLLFQVELG